jgi:hypothetical protein
VNLVPDIRTLLAVDVIASAQNPGYHRDRLWGALNGMLVGAFTGSGIRPDEVTHVEPGGDGALYTLPSTRLGTVSDLTERLDQLAAEHNRWSKPTLRLRAAIHLGAVSQAPHYCSAKILLTRLLNASRFKELVNECVQQNMDSAGNSTINSGLIVSGPAFPEVFGGDHTDLVREEQFASIDVTEKEFTDKAWIRVPGVDRRSLTEIADRLPNRSGQGDPIGDTRQQVITQHADTMTDSFQIGFLRGDINLGDSRRGRSIR